ncbi:MAG: Gfo/Idh/MocA family oxidoreductase [Leadbetterella sp.]|nr:Gfo/Idh/MocA family oxidoreductase [Leadbetterella sp.]
MVKKLKIAIIGLGRIGAEPSSRLGNLSNGWHPVSHAESIKSNPNLELVSVCDLDLLKVEKYMKMYQVPIGFSDYKKLIDKTKPELISIATRTNIKGEIVNYAIENGVKGIYIEKPLANSISGCEQIIKQAEKFGVKIIYGTQRRGMSFFWRAKELAYSGKLGKIQSITFEYGPSMLLWTLPHITDLIIYFSNSSKFKEISALCNFDNDYTIFSNYLDEDPLVKSAVIKMENDVIAYLSSGNGRNVRIHLEKGIITVNGDGYSLDVSFEGEFKGKFNEMETEIANPARSGTQELFFDLCNSVLNSTPLKLVSNQEIIAGNEILFGIIESALRNGSTVKYLETRKELTVTGRFGELYA